MTRVMGGQRGEEAENEKVYDENQKFDEFEGNVVGMFSFTEYDEAENGSYAVWEIIDKIMDSRHKDRQEARLKSNKRLRSTWKLYIPSTEEWDKIPNIGDYLLWNKKKTFKILVPIPDTLLEKFGK